MSNSNDNEVTLKIASSVDEFCGTLNELGFKITEEFVLDDYYYIPGNLDALNLTSREILSKAIIVRHYINKTFNEEEFLLIHKKKMFDDAGNILMQEKTQMELKNLNEVFMFLESIGYKELVHIYEDDIAYKKGDLSFAFKNVKDGLKLIESEVEEINENKCSIDKIIESLKKEGVPLDYSDYFVKKAEVEVDKKLNRN